MKKSLRTISIMVLMTMFVSCATLSKNECLQADWYEIGRKDGMMGQPRALFQKHDDVCSKHSVKADRVAYYHGREDGLTSYCTEKSGYEEGRAGKTYRHICPPALEPDFLVGFEQGRKLYKFESEIASLESRLKRIENQIQTREKQLYSPNLSDTKRSEIRADLHHLDLQYRDVVRDLKYLEKMRPVALYE